MCEPDNIESHRILQLHKYVLMEHIIYVLQLIVNLISNKQAICQLFQKKHTQLINGWYSIITITTLSIILDHTFQCVNFRIN